jgi:hypothetical protein
VGGEVQGYSKKPSTRYTTCYHLFSFLKDTEAAANQKADLDIEKNYRYSAALELTLGVEVGSGSVSK